MLYIGLVARESLCSDAAMGRKPHLPPRLCLEVSVSKYHICFPRPVVSLLLSLALTAYSSSAPSPPGSSSPIKSKLTRFKVNVFAADSKPDPSAATILCKDVVEIRW